MRRLLLAILLVGPVWAQDLAPIAVQSTERNGHLYFSAQFSVPVAKPLAFAVLSDFEHMSEFMPNMSSSKVLSRKANRWVVQQEGQLQLGLLSWSLNSTREIELIGLDEIVAHSLDAQQGAFSSRMQLQQQAQSTTMSYAADWQPASGWMASLGKQYVQQQMQQQFAAMQKEMLRRSKMQLASAPQIEVAR
ncbi:SRPBCC family protein [Chitinibacter tainanensis]|uniref:SRPBCC family protein n=1 Tax=Chitinibacter tainanensis TaxID=230667 RepID=UPI002357C927|nr:SRPBCC family protein [Chitinibacter tainanensis]